VAQSLSLILIQIPRGEIAGVALLSISSPDDKLQPCCVGRGFTRPRFAWYFGMVHCVHKLQRGGRITAVGRNRFIAPFLVDLIDGNLSSRGRNKAIAPYDRWSRCVMFRRVQKCSTQGRTSTSHDQALRGWRIRSR
jgi:hypothetical protein